MSVRAGSRSTPWLFGPQRDLWIGCGLATSLVLLLWAGTGYEIPERAAFVFPLLTLIFSAPHYGATLVRAYDQRADRRAYWNFTVYASIAIAALFVGGVHSVALGTWIATLYITWSPWHYTGQNYGLAMMFLRRRGVDVDTGTRRLVRTWFTLSYALTFVVLHGARPGAGDLFTYAGNTVRFLPLGIPEAALSWLLPPLLLGYLAVSVLVAMRLLARSSPLALLPVAALMLTQTVWFTAPYLARHLYPDSGLGPDQDYILWSSVGHGVQYLWVTTHFARGSAGWHGIGHYLGKTLLAGAAIWALPTVLFAPDLLGGPEFDAGLAMLVASAVNLHHFVLDGAVWKLRQTRVSRVLVDGSATQPPDPIQPDPTSALRRAVWTIAGLGLTAQMTGLLFAEIAVPRAITSGDTTFASATLDRLAWIGRDSAARRNDLGLVLARAGDAAGAEAAFSRGAELRPTVDGAKRLAALRLERGDPEGALDALAPALALRADEPELLFLTARSLLGSGHPERAQTYARRLQELMPGHPQGLGLLAEVESALARPADAGPGP